ERIAEAGGLAGVGAHALLGELNTFEINEAKNALTELHAEIDGIGAGHDVFDDMADRIHDIAVEANLSADAVAELLAALDNKRAQKTVADISKTVTNLSDDLKSLTSDGANPFHELIEDLEETRAELLALGEDITEIDELLDEAFTQAATHDLMSGLNVASDALRQLGSVAGGALGEVVNGLASAVDVAQQFVS